MYNFKINKETKELEIVKEMMNVHPSVIDTKSFDEIFTREYARFEYFGLLSKAMNGTAEAEETKKIELLEEEFDFSFSGSVEYTFLTDLNSALKPLMILTLFAHGKLLKSFGQNDDGEYRIKAERISLGLTDFYKVCRNTIIDVENGSLILEDAVQTIKPFYNESTNIINHDAVDGVCKKWVDSTKEKVTRSFVTGLLSRYKLTRSNRIKAESPLKSQEAFEKYFAMWLVTNGEIVNKNKTSKESSETFSSICNRK